jgi:Zn ribbon nucleic-acid-binding protein
VSTTAPTLATTGRFVYPALCPQCNATVTLRYVTMWSEPMPCSAEVFCRRPCGWSKVVEWQW